LSITKDALGQNLRESTAILELWHHLAHSDANLIFILNYLVSKCVDKSLFEISKVLILSLYHRHNTITLNCLVHYLTIEGIVQVWTTISQSTSDNLDLVELPLEESSKESTTFLDMQQSQNESKKTLEISLQLRTAVVRILSDLVTQDVMPLLPHIHILFNYILLRFENSTEGVHLAHLFYVLLVAIRGIVHGGGSSMTDADRSALEALITLLKVRTLKLQWAVTTTPPLPPLDNFMRPIPTTATTIAIDTPRRSAQPWHDNLEMLLNWFVESARGECIVPVLLGIISAADSPTPYRSGERKLYCGLSSFQIWLSTMALEIYSEMRKPIFLISLKRSLQLFKIRSTWNFQW